MKKDYFFGLIAEIIFAFVFSFFITNSNIEKSLLITFVSSLCALVQHGVKTIYNKKLERITRGSTVTDKFFSVTQI